jgi:hypothetical protein
MLTVYGYGNELLRDCTALRHVMCALLSKIDVHNFFVVRTHFDLFVTKCFQQGPSFQDMDCVLKRVTGLVRLRIACIITQ